MSPWKGHLGLYFQSHRVGNHLRWLSGSLATFLGDVLHVQMFLELQHTL